MKKILSLLFLAVLFVSCGNIKSEKHISVSILPLKYFTEKIVGDKWSVGSVIPAGASHSSYEPSSRDIAKIANSALYFKTGNIGFEDAWSKRFEEVATETDFIDVSTIVDKIGVGHYHGDVYHGTDPHYWMSPKRVKMIAYEIYMTMLKYDPENKDYYYNNYIAFAEELDTINNTLSNMLKSIAGTEFLIYHPSLTYFAADYHLEQIAIEDHGKEPSATHLAYIINKAKQNNIKVIFYQKQYTGQSVKTIANEIDATTMSFDPLSYNWKESIFEIAQQLLDANSSK